jgi:hypothetical protein
LDAEATRLNTSIVILLVCPERSMFTKMPAPIPPMAGFTESYAGGTRLDHVNIAPNTLQTTVHPPAITDETHADFVEVCPRALIPKIMTEQPPKKAIE